MDSSTDASPKATPKPKVAPSKSTTPRPKTPVPTNRKPAPVAKKPVPTKRPLQFLKKKPVPSSSNSRLSLSSMKKIENDVSSAKTGRPARSKVRVRVRTAPSVFPRMATKVSLPPLDKDKTQIIPIGGLRTIGANMTLFRHGKDMLIVDGGLEFSGDDTPGVDSLVPDIRPLIAQKENIVGMLITHGHLDHIGALKNIVPALGYPTIYGAAFTIAMIQRIFEEAGIKSKTKFVVVNPDSKQLLTLGAFKYEFFRVNHTIPDACGVYIETPNTRVMHMGDYKIDFSPRMDKPTDLPNMARFASKGIDILLQETTNSYKQTWTTTEAKISGELDSIIRGAKDRIIIGNFSTLISRVQDVITIAEKYGRYVFINGRSMINHVAIAREMGYLKCKQDTIRELTKKNIESVPEHKQLIITTGAQGEYYGGLGIMSRGDHRVLSVKPRDTIVLSSSVIPGNEIAIIDLVNRLNKFGPNIITIKDQEVHSGGHGGILEQKVIVNLLNPKIIIPVHGDLTQRLTFKREAVGVGFDTKNIFMLEDGAMIDIGPNREVINTRKKLALEVLVVDGKGIGSTSNNVMKDRLKMHESGVLVLSFNGKKTCSIESRGLFFPDEVRDAHKMIVARAKDLYEKHEGGDSKVVTKTIRSEIEKFVTHKWDRETLVIPVI